jgi:hypothetical protein
MVDRLETSSTQTRYFGKAVGEERFFLVTGLSFVTGLPFLLAFACIATS